VHPDEERLGTPIHSASHHDEREDAEHNYQQRSYAGRAFRCALQVVSKFDCDRIGSGEHE
jgi:hypothetical protein